MHTENRKILIFIISSWIALADTTKWLINNPGFDNPDAWESGYLPCAEEEIVFPADYDAVLPLPKEVDVTGFLLPRDGAILLNQDATINLGSHSHARRCRNGNDAKALLKKPTTRKWYDPESWRITPDMSVNNALPHMERVPCMNDSVVIQQNGPLSLDLQYLPYLRLGQLNLAGSVVAKDYLAQLLSSEIGQVLFKHTEGVKVEYYRNDVCGCHRDMQMYIDPICDNVMVHPCKRAHCLAPLLPFESCCPICGALLSFATERCDESLLHKLRKHISSKVSEQGLWDELNYHVSYINSQDGSNFLQAIVVDKDDYSEKSVQFMRQLNASTDWNKLLQQTPLHVQLSGRPYHPNITFFSIMLIILCLLLVSIVALVIFAHYAPDHRYLRHIPQWVYDPNRWRSFIMRSSILFARFDNAGGGAGGDGRGSIGGGGLRESEIRESIIMSYDPESGEVRERAFDNPMFGNVPPLPSTATTTTSVATVPKAKEPKKSSNVLGKEKKSERNLETINLVDAEEGDEEQELTEIKLESASDSDDDDQVMQETKE